MKIALLLLPCAVALSGCVMFRSTPPDLAYIKREHSNSAKVAVREFEVIHHEGQTLLAGRVGRLFFEADTSKTHLDVTLYAADGAVLRSITAEFTPRQVYRGHRMPGSSSYRVPLDPLPPNLARITVSAHDGAHATQ
jgi:hypothetical protein